MLVTTTQVLATCFGLLSHVVEDGGVLCRVRLFLLWVCSCGGVCFGLLCTDVVSSYMACNAPALISKKIRIP
jgi:hypothetical protein